MLRSAVLRLFEVPPHGRLAGIRKGIRVYRPTSVPLMLQYESVLTRFGHLVAATSQRRKSTRKVSLFPWKAGGRPSCAEIGPGFPPGGRQLNRRGTQERSRPRRGRRFVRMKAATFRRCLRAGSGCLDLLDQAHDWRARPFACPRHLDNEPALAGASELATTARNARDRMGRVAKTLDTRNRSK